MLINEILNSKYTVIYGSAASGKSTLALFTIGREALRREMIVAVATTEHSASAVREYLPTLQHVVQRVEDLPPVDVAIIDSLLVPWSKDIPDLNRAKVVIETRRLGRNVLPKAYIHPSVWNSADVILKLVTDGENPFASGVEIVKARQFEMGLLPLSLVGANRSFRQYLVG